MKLRRELNVRACNTHATAHTTRVFPHCFPLVASTQSKIIQRNQRPVRADIVLMMIIVFLIITEKRDRLALKLSNQGVLPGSLACIFSLLFYRRKDRQQSSARDRV
jgi:hypothetical protein